MDEPHAGQAARPERPQEGRPEGALLAVADGQPQHLAVAPLGDPGGDDDGLGDDRRALAGLDVGRVEEDVREADMGEGAVAEGGDDAVELAADAADLALADAGVDAQGGHQVVHLARRDAVHVGLHDDRPEGPVDAPARFEQRREEGALPELGDAQVEVTGLGR